MLKNLFGSAALLKTFDDLRPANIDKELVKDSRRIARGVRDRVRAEAPRGPTGNLRRGVEDGTFKKRPGKPPMSFVRVSRRIAPHAHLVEFGARGGQMPANPFFRRATSGDGPLDEMENAAGKVIDGVLK